MAVSQKQIAEKLGVSIALVSRVLSGKAVEIGIAPDTIERVMTEAKAMGYVPSVAALTLKGKATRTIGVAVYDFNDPFFGTLIKQFQKQTHEHNYSLVLAGFLNRTPDEQDLQSLHKHSLDGLIVIGTELDAGWLKNFQQIPVARIGHGSPSEKSVRVTIDEEQAGGLLINHLLQRDRKRLMFVSADLPAHRIRKEAFERVAKACGVELLSMESDQQDAFEAGLQIVRGMSDVPDALICATDQVAMGALNALHGAGIAVPDQVAVTGFDNIPAATQFVPPITTISQPLKEMVKLAFSAITDPVPAEETRLPGTLRVHQTA